MLIILSGINSTIIFSLGIIVFIIFALISVLLFVREYKGSSQILIRSKKRLGKDIDLNYGSLPFLNKKSENNNENNKKNGERFSELVELDKKLINKNVYDKKIEYTPIFSLKTFTEDFRNFCASSENHLYYTIEDIRSFIANLGTSKTMILQGMSGTGKTSLALAFERFVKNPTIVIPVQPMWKERSDLVGYYNEFTKKFNETPLLKELYRATYSNEFFIIVLDEMNIARVEYYFAEFLSLLEYPNLDERSIEITNDSWDKDPKNLRDGRLSIGPNVFFIGTANNDESTFAISDKVYDRVMIMNLDRKAVSFKGEKKEGSKVSYLDFEMKINEAIITFDALDKEIIENWTNLLNESLIELFKISFGNRMVKQLNDFVPIYVACGGNIAQGFDDFISKKILRKLESLDRILIKDKVEVLKERLNKISPDLNKSQEFLRKLND